MDEKKTRPASIDAYIAQFPQEVQQILTKVRAVIHESAPEAEERISYGMPAFYLKVGLCGLPPTRHLSAFIRPHPG